MLAQRPALVTAILLLVFLLSGAGFVYAFLLDEQADNDSITAQALLVDAALIRNQQLQQKTLKIEADLKETQAAFDAKKAELDAISADLTKKAEELASAQKKIKSQESQLSANAAELSRLRDRPPLFSFRVDSSTVTNVEQKKEDVKQLVTDAYDVITEIYSKPYLLSSVTISFVESFSNENAAAEISIANTSKGIELTIRIKDFDKNSFNDVNSIIHEVIHSFHGIAVLDPVAYEEGIVVAATDVVMEKLRTQGKILNFSRLYIRINGSEYANTSLTLPSSGFYDSSDTSMYYQIAGYGWYQIYKADSKFFVNFNEKLYEKKRNGEEITQELVKQTIKEAYSGSVSGQSIDAWLQTKAFALR